MKAKMQYCFWCGQELGISEYDAPDTCGKTECNNKLQNACGAEEEELRHKAEQDHYDRYR